MSFEFISASSSYIESTSTPVTGVPFTMACWFHSNVASQGNVIMYMGNSASSHRFVLEISGTVIRFLVATGGAPTIINFTSGLAANTWYHFTAVCVSTTSRFIFLDGGDKKTNTVSRNPIGLNNITLGAQITSNTRSAFFHGRIAEVGIWNAALTDDEVLSLSKGFAPYLVRPSNLKFYNRCIEKSKDLSGGITLTEVGITSVDHPKIYG